MKSRTQIRNKKEIRSDINLDFGIS